MNEAKILVIDDDPNVIAFVEVALRGRGVEVDAAGSAEEAFERLEDSPPDAILLDVRLPGMSGLEALCRLQREGAGMPVAMITSHASMGVAIEAMREGAYDFLTKPLRVDSVETVVSRMIQERGSGDGEPIASAPANDGNEEWRIVGSSPAIVEVYKTIGRVARTDATVLVTGESGTGKELVARVIHQSSPRREARLEAVNCAAIPEHLLESELFGHEKGAFTGSVAQRIGKFERAHRGTLLLDEIGDMSLPLQSTILRALEEGVIERVGGGDPLAVDVRVLAATNQDLEQAVAEGRFRHDLFFRLAVVTIDLPPLRERAGDVRLLIDFFVRQLGPGLDRVIERVEPDAYRRLEAHDWPGNVRELRNVIKRGLIVGQGAVLRAEDLPPLDMRQARPAVGRPENPMREFYRQGMSLKDVEKEYFRTVLDSTGWNYSQAAELLQIHRNTVRRKVEEFGLVPPA